MPLPPLENPHLRRDRVLGLTRAIPIVAFLSSTLLAINVAQTASLLVRPVSRQTFRRFNRWAADTWWGWCVTASTLLNNVQVRLTGDPIPMRENALIVVNHQQMPDITFLMVFARTKDRLGDLKWFVKKPIKYVPGIGWGMAFLDCLFVARDWAEDENSIRRTFESITRDDVPLWLISFSEGTRVTPEKVKQSHEYARQKGLPTMNHVLLPRTKGFVASVQGLRDHADAVYDITIGYQRGVPTLWQYINGFASEAHLHVRRYPVEQLPHGHDELAAWLMDRFREKDELLAHFYENGAFPATPTAG